MWCFDPPAALGLCKAAESACVVSRSVWVLFGCVLVVGKGELGGASTRMLRWGSARRLRLGVLRWRLIVLRLWMMRSHVVLRPACCAGAPQGG